MLKIGPGALVAKLGRTSVRVVSAASTASAALAPWSWKPLFVMARAAPEQAQPDDAVAHDHDGGENRVARQPGLLRRSRDHDGDDQRHLDHGHGDGQDQRAEGLADAVGDDLGVVDGREHGGDQSRSRRRGNEAAGARQRASAAG